MQNPEIEQPKNALRQFFRNPWVQSALNFTLANGAYFCNWQVQVFCQPVTWAAIVLIITFMPVVFWPLFKFYTPKWLPLMQFLRGIALCVCFYCIAFLETDNLTVVVTVIFGIGIFGLAPHIFLFQMMYQMIQRRTISREVVPFSFGILFSLLIAIYFVIDFRISREILLNEIDGIEAYDGPHQAGIERIVGMHFKYHTRILVGIDGWRPPLHDPALILGLWSVQWEDPLKLRLDKRIELYRKLFPDKNPQADCICAVGDGSSYRNSAWFE